MQQSVRTSIHNLRPLESGGVVSRGGFVYQDHIAISFLLDMVTNKSLEEVWCETHDDITLLWKGEKGQEVEFVQVKNLSLSSSGQLPSSVNVRKQTKTQMVLAHLSWKNHLHMIVVLNLANFELSHPFPQVIR